MREIKFRAWNGHVVFHVSHITFSQENFLAMGQRGNEKNVVYHTSNLDGTIMQYTGLKDKNGVEIYEGDIVEHDYYYFEGMDNGATGYAEWRRIKDVVTFSNGTFCYDEDGSPLDCHPSAEDDDTQYEFEENYVKGQIVIGNIYENKELLK